MAKQVEQKAKKPGFFSKAGRWIKSIFSELKKVSWPKINNVVKQTLIVLGVTAAFLILLVAVDYVLGLGFEEFIKALNS